MRNILNDITGLGMSLFLIVIGILFFFGFQIPWIVLYIAILLFCFLDPLTTWYAIHSGYKHKDPMDTRLSIFNLISGGILLLWPAFLPKYMLLFAGLWMLGFAFLSCVNAYVMQRDVQPGAYGQILSAVVSTIIGIFLIFGKSWHIKAEFLNIAAGIFFVVYGMKALYAHIRYTHPDSFIAKHTNKALSLPLLLSAFYPLRACISVRALKKSIAVDTRKHEDIPDLWVYFYLKDTGFEVFGHMDIAYKDTIYSYGCHDPHHRGLLGTLGDGVLIKSDRDRFLKTNAEIDQKTIIGYGIHLTHEQRIKLEQKINNMMSRTIPWQCDAQKDPAHQDKINDYASRMWKGSQCEFYKFKEGKFRTYFVASTNCVLLADELIRNKDLSLVTLNGIVAPGNYLTFLNEEYNLRHPRVTARTIYYEPYPDLKPKK